jgi:hypothetical protein
MAILELRSYDHGLHLPYTPYFLEPVLGLFYSIKKLTVFTPLRSKSFRTLA